jgi:hypothetical protein
MEEEPDLREAPHPAVWDLVCIGTGLVEALLAGAAARAGRTVLHLDAAEGYGAAWGVLTEAPGGGGGWEIPRHAPVPAVGKAKQNPGGADADAEEEAEEITLPARGVPVAGVYTGITTLIPGREGSESGGGGGGDSGEWNESLTSRLGPARGRAWQILPATTSTRTSNLVV